MSYVTNYFVVYDIVYDIVYNIINFFPGFSDSVRAPSSAGGQPDDTSIVWNTDDERDRYHEALCHLEGGSAQFIQHTGHC